MDESYNFLNNNKEQGNIGDIRKKREYITEKYYRERGMQKFFTFRDEQNAINTYSNLIQKPKNAFTDEDKKLAVDYYKQNNPIYLERENTLSNYMYTNYGLEDFKPSFELEQEFEENKKNMPFLETLFNVATGGPGGKAFIRGIGQLIAIPGYALEEYDENRRFDAKKFIEEKEKGEDFYIYKDLYEEYKELTKNKSTIYYQPTSRVQEIEKKMQEKYGSYWKTNFDIYESNKKIAKDQPGSIGQLGKSIQKIGISIDEAELLQTEFTKKVQAGEEDISTVKGSLLNPEWWVNYAPETVGQVAGLVGLTALTPGVPDEYVAVGYIVENLPLVAMFSASEAHHARKEAKLAGYSDEEADEIARKSFNMNFALQSVTGAVPGAWTKLLNKTKVFNSVIASDTSRRLAGIGIDMFMEGFEEVAQDSIQQSLLNDKFIPIGEQALQTFVLGAIGGAFGSGVQLAQEQSFKNTYDKYVKETGNYVEVLKNTYINQGMSEIEAMDKAMTTSLKSVSGTGLELKLLDLERTAKQEAVIKSILAPIESLQKQNIKIKNEQDLEILREKQKSKINGTDFAINGNQRIYNLPNEKTIESSSTYAITNMIMKEEAQEAKLIYDKETNSISGDKNLIGFANNIKNKISVYKKLNSFIKDLDTNYNTNDLVNYMKKHDIDNNEIHKLYNNKALTTKEYANALKKLNIKAEEKQLQDNINTTNEIEDVINNKDQQTLDNMNKIHDDLQKNYRTYNQGLDELVKNGLLNATDKNSLKQMEKDLIKQAEDIQQQEEQAQIEKQLQTYEQQIETKNDKISAQINKISQLELELDVQKDVDTIEENNKKDFEDIISKDDNETKKIIQDRNLFDKAKIDKVINFSKELPNDFIETNNLVNPKDIIANELKKETTKNIDPFVNFAYKSFNKKDKVFVFGINKDPIILDKYDILDKAFANSDLKNEYQILKNININKENEQLQNEQKLFNNMKKRLCK